MSDTIKFMKTPLSWLLVLAVLVGLMVPFAVPVSAAGPNGIQLVAFGVAVDSATPPNVTGIGWARGNSDKGWHEGAWIPAKAVISNVNLATLQNIQIGFDFTGGNQSTSPRFIDLVRDIQIGATDLTDSQGWPQTNGTSTPVTNASPFPTGNGSAPFPTLAAVEAAQNSIGEGQWPNFVLAETTPGWNKNTQVNVTYGGGAATATDSSHQFTITTAQINSALTSLGQLNTSTIVIYFQFHLARTFVWANGLESGYASGSSGSGITNPEGGWVYGNAPFIQPTPDKRNGSGYASGSSGHMYLNMSGYGADTTQLPVPPQPTGVISGYKWQDDNGNGVKDGSEPFLQNWGIHLEGTLEGGITFIATTYTDANGNYRFPNLVPGVWTVFEHGQIGNPPAPPTWTQTYPASNSAAVGAGVPTSNFTSPDGSVLGPEGWAVTLTDAVGSQGGLNFGNRNVGSLTVTKSVVLGSVVNPTGISQDFTITVTGPAPSTTVVGSQVFNLVNGVLQSPTSFTINNLVPGTYTVSEANPGTQWAVTGTGNVTVSGGGTASATVTNTFVPGALNVTKVISIPNGVNNAGSITDSFTVKVTGPSYPGPTGITQVFTYNGSSVSPDPWALSNLIPGNYTVTETIQGVTYTWTAAVTGSGSVTAGGTVSTTVTNTFVPGSLTVTKAVQNVPAGITQDFTIIVTGPSYPSGTNLTFQVVNGVLQTPTSITLNNLIPGSYSVSETNPGANWNVSGTGNVTVSAGQTASSTVTNTFLTGSLTVTKSVVLGSVVNPTGISQDFTITVTGPAPSTTVVGSQVFNLVNGVLQSPTSFTINNLVPGTYTVSEANPGVNWNVTGIGDITVDPGNTASATVTNTFVPGSLNITKVLVTTDYLFPNNINEDFTVTVTGPSYPAGTPIVFHVVNGVITDSPQTLNNLIPGAYTVSETDPADGMWTVTGGGNVTVNAGQTASSTITNTIKLPHTTMTLFAPSTFVTAADTTIYLTISDLNDGQVPLSNAHVHLSANGVLVPGFQTMFNSSPYFVASSDTNGNGLLDPGETWSWASIPYTITESTNFLAWGHGLDPLGNAVNYNAANPSDPTSVTTEHMTFEVQITNTVVDISATAIKIETGTATTLTVTEANTGDVALTSPHVVVLKDGAAFIDLVAPPTSGDTANTGVLDPGETWTWSGISTGNLAANTTFQATGHGMTPADGSASFDVTYPTFPTERDSVSINVIHPNTRVTITPSVFETSPGENVILTITEKNTGDVDLANAFVVLNPGAITLNNLSTGFSSDGNSDSTLAVGETWTWTYQLIINSTTTFIVTGHGTDILNTDITAPAYPTEQANVTVQVSGATRTQGFWATHLDFTTYVFNNYAGSDINLGYQLKVGTADVNSISRLMGIFWANNAKNSDGSKRTPLGQARETAANQALAAILNSLMPGGKPLPSGITINSIANTLTNGTAAQINALNSTLDAFNNSGDTVALDPGLPATGKANPQGAKGVADIPWADTK